MSQFLPPQRTWDPRQEGSLTRLKMSTKSGKDARFRATLPDFDVGTYFDRPWAHEHRLFDVPTLDYRVDNWRSLGCRI